MVVMLAMDSAVRQGDVSDATVLGSKDVSRRGGTRPHLHLVPGGADAARPQATTDVAYARRRFAVACVALVVLAGAVLAGRAMASGAGEVSRHVVTVRAGETLSDVAAREMPAVRNDQAVVAIQHQSNLGSMQVEAGQKLVVPTP